MDGGGEDRDAVAKRIEVGGVGGRVTATPCCSMRCSTTSPSATRARPSDAVLEQVCGLGSNPKKSDAVLGSSLTFAHAQSRG